MHSLLKPAYDILRYVNLNPGTPIHLVLELVVALLAASTALYWVARLFELDRGAFGACILMVILGGTLTLLTAAAALVYLPDYFGKDPSLELVLISFVLTSLLLTVPLLKMMWRARFLPTLISFGMAALAGLAAVYIVNSTLDGVFASKKEIDKGLKHNRQVEKILDAK